jgi:hypothetical protein
MELAQEQARYHRTVAQLIRDASSPAEARVAIRARFPTYRLEVAIERAESVLAVRELALAAVS